MSRLIAAARQYLGVRFRHRGRTVRGLDCVGLAWKAYADCGLVLPDFLLYPKEPSAHGPGLTHYIQEALGEPVATAPVSEADLRVGDVVVMRFEVEPHHVGMITDYALGGFGLIHADGHTGRVIAHRLAPDVVRRITHVFRRPVE